jgi:hypothetical protein
MKLYLGYSEWPATQPDAARSARPKGKHFSVSLRIFHIEVLVTNGTGWKSRTR